MARTNSRKISRRGIKKKSPLPAVLLIMYMAGLCMFFVYLYMDSQRLNYELESKRHEVSESQSRIHNLTVEVEKLTSRRFVLRKIDEFDLELREPLPGQVFHVRHINGEQPLPAQTLREVVPAVVSRR